MDPIKRAGLLASGHRKTHVFPETLSQWQNVGLLPFTVAGPRRTCTDFPFQPVL